MYRWAACPGSVPLCEDLPRVAQSVYAEEGTKAHNVAAAILLDDYAGDDVPAEMAEAVQVYIDHLNDTFERFDVDHIEQRFDLSKIHTGCYGTADHVRWRPNAKLLIVTDYKHGAGIPVSPENNPQLMYYGLGALLECGYPAKRVRLVIVQPRCGDTPVKEWEIDALDLLDFSSDLKEYALATEQPSAPLVPGEHCRFCPAAGVCPVLRDRALVAATQGFTPVPSGAVSGVPRYDPDQLRKALDSREVVKAWLAAIDEFAYAEATAGRCPPGYKLVAKRATRKWKNELEAAERLPPYENLYDRSLKSPAQIEKLFGKSVDLSDLVVAESSGNTLVPESDKRPAVLIDAAAGFTAVVKQTWTEYEQGKADAKADLLGRQAFLKR